VGVKMWTDSPREMLDRHTPIPEREYILTAARTWLRFYGRCPLVKQLACCLAQMVLETGRERQLWGVHAHNYNWGNIKHSGGSSPKYWQFYRCAEIINGKQVWFDPPHPQTRFRAYESAEDGLMGYIQFLVFERTRYLCAWNRGVMLGDPVVFARELGRAGYYTASIARYTKTVVSLFTEFQSKVAEVLTSREANGLYAGLEDGEKERVMSLVGETVWDSYRGQFNADPEALDEEEARRAITPNV